MKSLAKSSNYYAVISNEKLKSIKYYLQSISTPTIDLQPLEVRSKLAKISQVGGSLEFSPINIRIIIDENLYNYTSLLDLIFDTINQETGELKDNKFNVDVFALSNKGNPIINFKYSDGYISSISSIEYNDMGNDGTMLTLDLQFVFTNFTYTILKDKLEYNNSVPGNELDI